MSICVNKYADLGYAFVNIWHSTVLLLFSVVLCSDMYARNSQEVATFTKKTQCCITFCCSMKLGPFAYTDAI